MLILRPKLPTSSFAHRVQLEHPFTQSRRHALAIFLPRGRWMPFYAWQYAFDYFRCAVLVMVHTLLGKRGRHEKHEHTRAHGQTTCIIQPPPFHEAPGWWQAMDVPMLCFLWFFLTYDGSHHTSCRIPDAPRSLHTSVRPIQRCGHPLQVHRRSWPRRTSPRHAHGRRPCVMRTHVSVLCDAAGA